MPGPAIQAPFQNNTLEAQLLRKAASIGPAQVGDRYVPTDAPKTLWDLVKQYILGGQERPTSVAAQDPFGILAWEKGAAPLPAMMSGSVEEIDPLAKQLYSRLTRAFEQAPEGKIHPSKALNLAKNAASKEEIEWRKLPEFLQSKGNTPVTKQEVLAHLEANPIKLKETVLGAAQPAAKEDIAAWFYRHYGHRPSQTDLADPATISSYNASRAVASPKYATYQTPGGENYRENLTQLDRSNERAATDYRSSHFDQPNILGHTRTNERHLNLGGLDPKEKGTFLEEVQSDWNQAGKEHGYNTGGQEELRQQADQIENELRALRTNVSPVISRLYRDGAFEGADSYDQILAQMQLNYSLTGKHDYLDSLPINQEEKTNLINYLGLRQKERQLRDQISSTAQAVPNNPFKESWPDLLLKRELLKTVNDPEKSWMGWTTGKTQNDRYHLQHFVDALHYDPEKYALTVISKDGEPVPGYLDKWVPPEELPKHIGQETAQQLLKQPRTQDPLLKHDPNALVHTLNPKDLEIGGQGMKYFYDQLLPARMNRILKPFGGKVELGELPTGIPYEGSIGGTPISGPQTFQAWIAKLTPEMKQRIAKEGLPLLTTLYMVWQHQQKAIPQDKQ